MPVNTKDIEHTPQHRCSLRAVSQNPPFSNHFRVVRKLIPKVYQYSYAYDVSITFFSGFS